MYEPFPGNYVWNLSTNLALCMGGSIGEMETANARIRAAAVNNIAVPFLITHGAHDRQIPLAYAHQCYEEAVNSPKRELKIFTDREGGVEHCSADNMEPARSYIADWIARTFSSFPVAAR